jgi:hypothetical protein
MTLVEWEIGKNTWNILENLRVKLGEMGIFGA